MSYIRCAYCDEFYLEDEEVRKEVSGSRGHIDNWMPDETYYYCPHCLKDASDNKFVELEDLINEIEDLRFQLSQSKRENT